MEEQEQVESLQTEVKVLIGRVEHLEKSDKDQTARLNAQKLASTGFAVALAMLGILNITSDPEARMNLERTASGIIAASIAAYVGSSAVKAQ